MKKNLRKLQLSRETVRTLANLAPVRATAGTREPTLPDTIYDTICDYTYSCTCPGACTA